MGGDTLTCFNSAMLHSAQATGCSLLDPTTTNTLPSEERPTYEISDNSKEFEYNSKNLPRPIHNNL